MVVDLNVRDIFIDAQRSINARSKLVSRLRKVHEAGEEGFFKAFTNHVKHSLVVYTREPAVERTIDFIVEFATTGNKDHPKAKQKSQNGHLSDEEEEDVMSPFLSDFFNFLLDLHDSHSKAVRFRVCQIINKLFDALSDETSIDEDLAGRIYDCMLIRLTDKFPNIRVQAVKAIYRLQDIQDQNCPVVESFIHLMEKDNSPDVRRAALQNIAVTHQTLKPILNRTRDVKNAVRKAAYEVLAEKVKIKSLTIAQRLKLLDDGLNDRSAMVKKTCAETLLRSWLVDLEENVPRLLKCFHVESSSETTVLALKTLLQGASIENIRKHISHLKSLPQAPTDGGSILIQYDHLEPEVAIYWRVLAQQIDCLENNDELRELVLPLASEFCDYVERFANSHKLFDMSGKDDENMQQSEFVMQQLLLLCGCLDYTDEIGRKRMQTLTRTLFLDDNTPFTLVENLVARFAETETNEETFVQSLVELISEIKEPMIVEELPRNSEEIRKKEIELAKMKMALIELRESLDDAIKEENFTKAAEIKKEIAKFEEKSNEIKAATQPQSQAVRIEKNDPFTILKCLYISSEMLQKVQKRVLTPTIQSLAETLIWPSVQDEDMLIRNAAIKCVGLIAMLSKDFATQNFVLFLQAAQIDVELVQITATQVIFDLIQMYGFDAFETDKTNPGTIPQGGNTSPVQMETSEDEESPIQTIKEATYAHLSLGSGENASASDIIVNALIMLLDGESQDIRFVVVEGMCKLLLSGRIRSPKLYARLVLLWYNPAVSDDFRLKQCLGVFLPNFALASRVNQELVDESFFPILRTLFDAPDTSPLAEVDPLSVVELLVQLTSLRNRQNHAAMNGAKANIEDDANVHDSLALRVANEILSDSEETDMRTLCKALSMLEVSMDNEMAVKELDILCNRIIEDVEDKISCKFVQKFQATLPFTSTQETDPNFIVTDSTVIVTEIATDAHNLDNETEAAYTENRNDNNKKTRGTASRAGRTFQPPSSKMRSQKTTTRQSKRKSRKVDEETNELDDDSNTSEEGTDAQPTRRVLAARASKTAALETTKMNLESVLMEEDSDESETEDVSELPFY